MRALATALILGLVAALGLAAPAWAASQPDPPTDLVATSGDGQVTLTWTAPAYDGGAPITNYPVYAYDPRSNGWLLIANPTTTTTTITGLTNGSQVRYAVAAHNSAGTSRSVSVTLTVEPFPLSPSFSVSGAALVPGDTVKRGSSVTASGTGLPEGAQVSLSLRSGSGPLATDVAKRDGSYSVTGTIPASAATGSDYLTVTATASSGATRSSGQSITIIPGASRPGAPTGLTATAGDGQVSLQWTAPADDGGAPPLTYLVVRQNSTGSSTVATVQSTSATITGLTNGVAATYAVIAENSAGSSDTSDAVTVTPFTVSPTFRVDGEVLASGDPLKLGASVTASGAGLPIGATVSMKLRSGSAPLASAVVSDGSYTLTGTVPATTPVDADSLVVTVVDASGTQRTASLSIDIAPGQPVWPRASAWPDQLSAPDLNGLAFTPDGSILYATQFKSGISTISSSGEVTQIVNSRTLFLAVAAEIDGNLLVTVDDDPNIYRIDMADLKAHPSLYLRNGGWKDRATIAYTSTSSVLGVAAAPDGTIYFTTSDNQINVLRAGVSTPLLAEPFTTRFSALGVFIGGILVAVGADDEIVYGVDPTDVAAGAVARSALQPLATGIGGFGIAFFSDATFYTWSGTKHAIASPPDQPTGLAATAGDGQVSLQWSAPQDDGGADVTSYVVQTLRGDTWTDVATSETTGATITGLTNGTEGAYRVLAVNIRGAGDPSDSVMVAPYVLAPTFSVGDSTIGSGDSLTAGTTVTVSGSGLPPGSTVTLELHSTPITLATGVVRANGSYTLTGTIPAYAVPGSHNLVVTVALASGAQVSVSQPVTIAAAPAVNVAGGPSAVSLAATGADEPAPLLFAAGLALLAGIALCVPRRRRVGLRTRSRERATES